MYQSQSNNSAACFPKISYTIRDRMIVASQKIKDFGKLKL